LISLSKCQPLQVSLLKARPTCSATPKAVELVLGIQIEQSTASATLLALPFTHLNQLKTGRPEGLPARATQRQRSYRLRPVFAAFFLAVFFLAGFFFFAGFLAVFFLAEGFFATFFAAGFFLAVFFLDAVFFAFATRFFAAACFFFAGFFAAFFFSAAFFFAAVRFLAIDSRLSLRLDSVASSRSLRFTLAGLRLDLRFLGPATCFPKKVASPA